MNKLKIYVLVVLCAGLFGCLEETYDTSYSDTGSSSGGSSGGSSSGGSYDWTYTCPGGYGGGGTVPIPSGSCETQYKNYAQVFGCNDVGSFNSAACSLQDCTGENMGCGYY